MPPFRSCEAGSQSSGECVPESPPDGLSDKGSPFRQIQVRTRKERSADVADQYISGLQKLLDARPECRLCERCVSIWLPAGYRSRTTISQKGAGSMACRTSGEDPAPRYMPIAKGCVSSITPLAAIRYAIGIPFASARRTISCTKSNRSASASRRNAGALAREMRSDTLEMARASCVGSLGGKSRSRGSDTCHIRRKLRIHRSLFDPAYPKDPINLLASVGGLDSRLGHGEFSIAVQHVFIIAVCERVVEQCPLLHGWKGWCSRDAYDRNSFRVSSRYCR
jgi:hypothetical protein